MSDKGTHYFSLKSPFCIWELVWLWKCSPSWMLLTIRFTEHGLHFLKHYCVHTLSCVGICVHECVSMWGQRSGSGVFLNCSPFYFLRQSLPLDSEVSDSARLVSHWAPGILLFQPPRCWDYRCVFPHLAFVYGFWALHQLSESCPVTFYSMCYFFTKFSFLLCPSLFRPLCSFLASVRTSESQEAKCKGAF